MKTNIRQNFGLKKNKKHVEFAKESRSVPRKDRKPQKLLRCYEETSGHKILRRLCNYLRLNINVWKNGQLVKKFGCGDKKSQRVDIEFRPSISTQRGQWVLKDKNSKISAGCLLNLMADQSKTSPYVLRKVMYEKIRIPYPNTAPENTWLEKSHGGRSYVPVDEPTFPNTTGYCRKNASYPPGVHDYRPHYGVESHSLITEGVPAGFESFQQQEVLLFYVTQTNQYRERLSHFLSQTDDVYQLMLTFRIMDLDIPTVFFPMAGAHRMRGEQMEGWKPIDSVFLGIRFFNHEFPRVAREKRRLMVYEFLPILDFLFRPLYDSDENSEEDY